MIEFRVNGSSVAFDGPEDVPLLWVLRDHLGLKGTKFGCGIGACGSCTAHVDGRARRTCVTTVSAVGGAEVTTIEGLTSPDRALHPVQQAWVEEDVAQCGYCQAGQIMAAVDLLRKIPRPSDEDVSRAMSNICRCGTYPRVRKAVRRAADLMVTGNAR